ncbi:hypothetical protein AX16_009006 [Volvariella volvacea WC 439]|nr:hypothetical protein AX16_009006 [Volvariella volvacea WC 439]
MFRFDGPDPAMRFPPFPPANQRQHIKHLFLDSAANHAHSVCGGKNQQDHMKIIPDCPNLQNLVVSCFVPQEMQLLDQLTSVLNSPQRTVAPPGSGLLRLSLSLSDLFPDDRVDFKHQVFSDLTHLEVVEDGLRVKWEDGNNYSCLKKLQYLSFTCDSFTDPSCWDTLAKCLDECKVLKVLIISDIHEGEERHVECQEKTSTLKRKVTNSDRNLVDLPEDRVVLDMSEADPKFWEVGWVNGIEGGEDMWTRAEAVVESRRASFDPLAFRLAAISL